MREYDQETLQRIQSVELGILDDFIWICKKYHLEYFGFGGTGIGVLRHGGFIPWDDDIDVALTRKDYDTFLQAAEKEFGDKYVIMNAQTDPNYPLATTRWMLRGTKFREYSMKDIDCPLGIFLDIYAFDNVPDDDALMRKQAREVWFWNKLMILRSLPFPVLGFTGVKGSLIKAACAVIHYGMAVCHISKKWLASKMLQATTRYNHLDTKRLAYYCDTSPYTNMMEKEELYPLQELDFEGRKMTFPREMHRMLEVLYGDYMQLPPPEKRKNHFPYELDFGDHLYRGDDE